MAFGIGCERQPSAPEENTSAFSLNEIPRFTSSAEKQPTAGSTDNPDYFTCVVSTLLGPDGEDNYRYNTYKIKLPEGFSYQKQNISRKVFVYGSKNAPAYADQFAQIGGITRVAHCRMPDRPELSGWLDATFKEFGTDSWISSTKARPQQGKGDNKTQDYFMCTSWQHSYICIAPTEEGCESWSYTGSECTSYMLVDEGPLPGGGGTPGSGSDPCEPCEPRMPCEDRGGTPTGCSPGSGGGGATQPPLDEPCQWENPPPEANCGDPCDTSGEHPVIDSEDIQTAMQILWQKTQETEDEQGAFIYKNCLDNWSITILTGEMIEYADYESIEFYIPSNLPDSSLFMHTHPDREILRKYGITNEYKNKPSDDDYEVIEEQSKLVKGYILDEDMIIAHDDEEITDTITRCSY